MPEFIPEMTPADLPDEFTQAYVEAIEWLLDDSDDNERGTSDQESATGFAPETIAKAIEDCKMFQQQNCDALALAYEIQPHYSDSQAGVDYWLTRNRHGAGFWDRGLGVVGKELTDAAHADGSRDSYVGDDGLIYLA